MAPDKELHLLTSVILVIAIYIVTGSLISSALIVITIGLGKEFIWDMWLGKGTPDIMDILYDAYGIMLGILIVGIFNA